MLFLIIPKYTNPLSHTKCPRYGSIWRKITVMRRYVFNVVRTGFEPVCSCITEYYLMTFQYLCATYATDFHLLHWLPISHLTNFGPQNPDPTMWSGLIWDLIYSILPSIAAISTNSTDSLT